MNTSSIKRTRPQILALLVAPILLLGGCSPEVETSTDEAKATQPTTAVQQESSAVTSFSNVEHDELADVSVEPITDRVTWDEATEASRRHADPAHGEHFAVLAAQYLTDSRDHKLPATEVDYLVDGPATLRNYLIEDHAGQVTLDTKRHIDPDISAWIRSDVKDDGSVVRTQLNAYMRASVGGQPADAWVRFRVDVRHDGSRWWVTGFNNALGSFDVELTDQQKELYFYSGEGWRRIPASK